jgi:hypothetical protein
LAIDAERMFSARIVVAVSPGLGKQLDLMQARLDQKLPPFRMDVRPPQACGIVNDALAIYFADPTLAAAFVSRWCVGYRIASHRRKARSAFVRTRPSGPRVLTNGRTRGHVCPGTSNKRVSASRCGQIKRWFDRPWSRQRRFSLAEASQRRAY